MKNTVWLIFIMTGCASVYVPNSRNSPLFRKAGEVQGSVGFGNGFDAQGAIAVTNHIGLMANYSYENRHSNQSSSNPDDDDYHYHQFFEGGLGYYRNQGNWCYEIFGGYGSGKGTAYDNYVFWGNQMTRGTGKYNRIFIQPAFGMNKKMFHMSIVPRISIVDFTEFSGDATSVPINENPKAFFEPAFVGRINLMNNHLFFAFQGGFSVPFDSDFTYQYRPIQVSTGLGFRFGGIHLENDEH